LKARNSKTSRRGRTEGAANDEGLREKAAQKEIERKAIFLARLKAVP
jgi:hypothetical protein